MLKNNLEKLKNIENKLTSLSYSENLIYWDALTVAPKNSVENRSIALEGIAKFYYETLISDNTKEILLNLEASKDKISDIDNKKVEILKEEYEKIANIPIKEYSEFKSLTSKSNSVWEEAKRNNDYKLFKPYLKKVIETTKRFIEYRNLKKTPYNVLVDDFEKGMDIETLDVFFKGLKKEIVPLIEKIKEKKLKKSEILNGKFDINKQKIISNYFMEKLLFNKDIGILNTSEHPFTVNMSPDDVRITTHYYENNVKYGLLSTIHETGHALYEQNVGKELGFGVLSTGTSMGIHESQSRIFENNFAGSFEFWECFYPKLKEVFKEEFKDVDLKNFYKAFIHSEPSLIRVDADELTYPLHIMVRYEIEKMIFENNINIEDLPEIWNTKYKEYLGIVPRTFSEGILQDVHWSDGLFGYFPSYALGSAYAAQFEYYMNKEFNIKKDLKSGNFENILGWLKNNIHKFGRSKNPNKIIFDATKESFNPKYFMDYLKEKYSLL
jgi:carboxypeptidase Taq